MASVTPPRHGIERNDNCERRGEGSDDDYSQRICQGCNGGSTQSPANRAKRFRYRWRGHSYRKGHKTGDAGTRKPKPSAAGRSEGGGGATPGAAAELVAC